MTAMELNVDRHMIYMNILIYTSGIQIKVKNTFGSKTDFNSLNLCQLLMLNRVLVLSNYLALDLHHSFQHPTIWKTVRILIPSFNYATCNPLKTQTKIAPFIHKSQG